MKKGSAMLYLVLLIAIILSSFGCARGLPPDFPKPPAVTLCTPISKSGAFSHWACENTGSREKTSQGLGFVQIGTPIEDWNKAQAYRREVEAWIIKRCVYTGN